ncbi:MAG: hypothetical protein LBP31_03490 [Holosporales bacterium]|jgi:hypothetical protein|nr:hypothetical protein [Holosporales bacterium]
MQVLSITDLHIDVIIFVCGLLSAAFCVFAKNTKDSILWFIITIFSVFSTLVSLNASIVGIVATISCVSMAAALLLIVHNQNNQISKVKTPYIFAGIVVIGTIFALIHVADRITEIDIQHYDYTISIVTILLMIVFTSVVFGSRQR